MITAIQENMNYQKILAHESVTKENIKFKIILNINNLSNVLRDILKAIDRSTNHKTG